MILSPLAQVSSLEKKESRLPPVDLFKELRTRGTSARAFISFSFPTPGAPLDNFPLLYLFSVPRAVRHRTRFSTPVTRTRFIPAVPSCFIVSYPVIRVTRCWSRSSLTGWGIHLELTVPAPSAQLAALGPCAAPLRIPDARSCLQSPVTLCAKSSFHINSTGFCRPWKEYTLQFVDSHRCPPPPSHLRRWL